MAKKDCAEHNRADPARYKSQCGYHANGVDSFR